MKVEPKTAPHQRITFSLRFIKAKQKCHLYMFVVIVQKAST